MDAAVSGHLIVGRQPVHLGQVGLGPFEQIVHLGIGLGVLHRRVLPAIGVWSRPTYGPTGGVQSIDSENTR